jgi:hypothetical protein
MNDHLGTSPVLPLVATGATVATGTGPGLCSRQIGPVEVPRQAPVKLRTQDRPQAPAAAGRIDDLVISLSAEGVTTGEIAAHLAEIYGRGVPPDDLGDHRCRPRRYDRLAKPPWTRSIPSSSSTRSGSRSATGRSPTGPSTSRWP